MWLALGDYRGPASAKCFIGYASAIATDREAALSYRSYVSDCLRAVIGADRRWVDVIQARGRTREIDAESVINDVIERAGLEVI